MTVTKLKFDVSGFLKTPKKNLYNAKKGDLDNPKSTILKKKLLHLYNSIQGLSNYKRNFRSVFLSKVKNQFVDFNHNSIYHFLFGREFSRHSINKICLLTSFSLNTVGLRNTHCQRIFDSGSQPEMMFHTIFNYAELISCPACK